MWTSLPETMDLRLRCQAKIEWFDTDALAIEPNRRPGLLGRLNGGRLKSIVHGLANHLRLDAETSDWERTPDSEGFNDLRFASYRLLVPGPSGLPAVGAWVRFQLPDGLQSTVYSIADVRVNFEALHSDSAGLGGSLIDPELRLTDAALHGFFTAAWETATRVLPLAATDDPGALRLAGPSKIELQVESERPSGSGGDRIVSLPDMLDLSRFGTPPASRGQSRMSIAVTAPSMLEDQYVAPLVAEGLKRMTAGFGFHSTD